MIAVRAGAELSADDVDAFARRHIGGYKRPRRFFFVDALPRNASGKALKRELRDRFADSEPSAGTE